jgi:hypothetical protein
MTMLSNGSRSTPEVIAAETTPRVDRECSIQIKTRRLNPTAALQARVNAISIDGLGGKPKWFNN